MQKPKVIVMDSSSLYIEDDEIGWRYVMDNMPISLNKMEFAYEFSLQDKSTGLLGAVIPTWRYHDRWKVLSDRDWTDDYRKKSYYTKGYSFYTDQWSAYGSEEEMDDYFQLKAALKNQLIEEYVNGQYNKYAGEKIYDCAVSKERLKWLEKIKFLCESQDINLLMVNIPKNDSIKGWNSMKYKEVKKICQNYDLRYWDMMYDADIDINWSTDTVDHGRHLNLLGANKVSESLGSFLIQNYNLNLLESKKWNNELAIYKEVENVAMLQLENNFEEYIRKILEKYSTKTIFISVSDDFYTGLTESEMKALVGLGLQSNFQDAYRKSFMAVIENGKVEYEALSNGVLDYNGVTNSGHRYELTSSGWLTGAEAHIFIDDVQVAVDQRGLNIVIYDDDLDLVLDSVCFDTFLNDYTCVHRSASEFLKRYENYVIENSTY